LLPNNVEKETLWRNMQQCEQWMRHAQQANKITARLFFLPPVLSFLDDDDGWTRMLWMWSDHPFGLPSRTDSSRPQDNDQLGKTTPSVIVMCKKENHVRNLLPLQSRLCQGGNSIVTSSTLGLPDGDDIFLIWTCGGCGQLEILV
jgi:hypothetical protein